MEPTPSSVCELNANVDDATGQVIGAALETLLAEGALDAWATHAVMKKGRPGCVLGLLCREEDRARLARRVIELTGSFGVRWHVCERVVLARRHEMVATRFGPIRVKVGSLEGRDVVRTPEFEDVRAAAQKYGVTPREVLASVPPHPAS